MKTTRKYTFNSVMVCMILSLLVACSSGGSSSGTASSDDSTGTQESSATTDNSSGSSTDTPSSVTVITPEDDDTTTDEDLQETEGDESEETDESSDFDIFEYINNLFWDIFYGNITVEDLLISFGKDDSDNDIEDEETEDVEEGVEPPEQRIYDITTEDTDTSRITMAFAGDVMLDRGVRTKVDNLGGGDYSYPWAHVASYLKGVDVAFVNLESLISDKGNYSNINLSEAKILGPWFQADPKAVEGLQAAGIDIVSVANNHIFDYNEEVMLDSLNNLENAGIVYAGAGANFETAYYPVYLTVKGKKIAFLAFTNKGNSKWRAQYNFYVEDLYGNPVQVQKDSAGVAWLYMKRLQQGIMRARIEGADIIVVSLHFGTDYTFLPSTAADKYAHMAMDMGANLVIGHGPHTIQPTMVYGKGLIAYSLGNFIFDQHEAYHTGVTDSKILEVTFEDCKYSSARELKVKINEDTCQPEFVD